MYRISHRKCGRGRRGSSIVIIAAALLSAAANTAPAQTSSPDITAEERRDPASGEVVIINRKKRKSSAPNPYAPKKREPTERKQAATGAPAKAAAPARPIIRRESAAPRVKPDLGAPESRSEEFLAPRRAVRPPSKPRAVPRRRRFSSGRRRPWRQCRILARRCQAGFEGSCYIWQRRCT